ncbi:MAG TPA: CehA/McbA family metallohydrolase [Pirellulales bacterium]|jgi:hypothetical protein
MSFDRNTYLLRAAGILSVVALATAVSAVEPLPLVSGVELQPVRAQVDRVAQALELAGAPLTPEQQQSLKTAYAEQDAEKSLAEIQSVLDPLCLAGVTINPESRVKVAAGQAEKNLVQHGWRVFLVKVANEAGVTAPLRVTSPNAAKLHKSSSGNPAPPQSITPQDVGERWLDVQLTTSQPLNKELSGLPLEYRLIELYSRDVGQREAKLMFDVGQGTQDLGFRNELNVLFNCEPAVHVALEVLDVDGQPTTGQFVFRDQLGRVYPSRARRMAPDLFFHDQIYRHSGETVLLPPGKFTVTYSRGPEYRILTREIEVPHAATHRESFRLERWIKLADHRWYSGDHHVHSAGCAHYESPAEGVQPEDMMRHIQGEDLNIGCVLSWGPCWYFQKQYFEGKVSALSTPTNLMRYDVEVSGFPSSHCGHLCLLRLKEDDYPGTTKIEEWPSWDLPVLKWGKEQGGIVGYSHSGWGLQVPATTLPTYDMPPFDGIGANEYIVDVVHDACDFISAVDTPFVWEMNIWYHTLNCGYTCRISGETDFPCIYGERVGLGRAYVKLKGSADQPLNYDEWALGIRDGRSYCTDGLAHLFDFTVNDLGVGEPGAGGRASKLAVKAGDKLPIRVRAAAMLEEKPRDDIRRRKLDQKPYWHVERARVGESRKVPVELIVNGRVVETREIEADGHIADLQFDYVPQASCWIALRVFAAAHTNPVFVEVDKKPICASRRSAQWCLDAVDVCWKQKVRNTRESEQPAAAAAYEVARQAYRKALAEAPAE